MIDRQWNVPTQFTVALGDWRLHLNRTSGKFIISRASRPDLRHLTLFWGTKSGELDIHLTREGASEGERWQSLFRFPIAELEHRGKAATDAIERLFHSRFLVHYRKCRPGWLAHRGYVVSLVEQEQMESWLLGIAPKRRGKYRVQPLTLSSENVPAAFRECFYDPRVLRDLALDGLVIPIHAVRVQRGKVVDREGILLGPWIASDGRIEWWGIKAKYVTAWRVEMLARFFDWLEPRVRPEHAEKFELIVKGLGLAESEGTAAFAAKMRRFLREPRNPVRPTKRQP